MWFEPVKLDVHFQRRGMGADPVLTILLPFVCCTNLGFVWTKTLARCVIEVNTGVNSSRLLFQFIGPRSFIGRNARCNCVQQPLGAL